MRPLVPRFILDRLAAGDLNGQFSAVGLFVDISGFSAMTDALMAHGQHGAEALAEIMRGVLDPLIECVFSQGGFIASSAGDSLTALFPAADGARPTVLRAAAAALAIQQHMSAHGRVSSPYQEFRVSAKVGLALGEAGWGILLGEKDGQGVYYFQGSAVEGCAEAEHHAQAGEIIVEAALAEAAGGALELQPAALPTGSAESRPSYRLLGAAAPLPAGQPYAAPPVDENLQARFYPPPLLSQPASGEFRQVVNMFIALPSVRTETQLRLFITSLFALQERYGGLLNSLDFGDKGTNLLLFWGAPVAYENDVERALNFILDLQTQTSLPLRVGITYRISHAGWAGGRLHATYACFGR